MGRGVMTHRHAVDTVYLHFAETDDNEGWFDDLLDDLSNILQAGTGKGHPGFPELYEERTWVEREVQVILRSEQVEISVSAYGSVVAICLAPRDPDSDEQKQRCTDMAAGFTQVLEEAFPSEAVRRLGGMSNGESVYRPLNRPEGIVTSREGVLW